MRNCDRHCRRDRMTCYLRCAKNLRPVEHDMQRPRLVGPSDLHEELLPVAGHRVVPALARRKRTRAKQRDGSHRSEIGSDGSSHQHVVAAA